MSAISQIILQSTSSNPFFLSAFLLILSFPPFDLGWLAWVALVPWLVSLDGLTPKQAFRESYLAGLLFFGGTIWWLIHVTFVGTVLLVAYLALYFAAWGWMVHRFRGANSFFLMIGIPAAWIFLEYLRGILFTGFGWNLLAHTQWHFLSIIQIADKTGVFGVSFLIVFVNACLYLSMREKVERRKKRPLIVALTVLLAVLAYGNLRLHQFSAGNPHSAIRIPQSFKVAVVQGNIPQTEKWDEAYAESIWRQYETLTMEALKEEPDLILWPETAVPGYLEEERISQRLAGIARIFGRPLLVGAPQGDLDGQHVFNAAVLITPEGRIEGLYRKVHLVPFGEYVPLSPIFSWLRRFILMGDFSPGNETTVFQPPRPVAPFGVLICFEDLFPGLARRFVKQGARWLIVITNDAWFGRSAASLQHLQASVFRAIENRVWVVRAANTGWSGFVDPTGRPRPFPSQVPRFKPGIAAAEILLDTNR